MSRVVLGADGCAHGWAVVRLVDGQVSGAEVVEELAEALAEAVVAGGVDIPIGLLDADRDADAAARRLLPGRASTVFSAPPRSVVDGWADGSLTTHAEASARARTLTGKGLSQQAFRLVPKVAEVDRLVRGGAPLHEVHPEVAFALLAGGALPSKRTWGGVSTRRALLARHGMVLPDRFPGDELAAVDDLLDAAVCAFVADGLAGAGGVLRLPEPATQLDDGRPVVITARRPPAVRPGPRRRPRAT